MIWLLLYLSSQLLITAGIYVVSESTVESNKPFFDASFEAVNEKNQNSMLNINMTLKKKLLKSTIYVEIYSDKQDTWLPDNTRPLKSIFSMDKLLSGVNGNMIVRAFMMNFFQCIDFEPKMPFLPGKYRIMNLTLTDQFSPLIVNTTVITVVRFVGKFPGTKSNVFMARLLTRNEFIPSIQFG